MAIVVPLLVSAGLGAAGIVGTAATLWTAAAGIVSAKTGLSKKIDKAAGKVFGDDLVQVANVAGAFFAGDVNTWGANTFGAGVGVTAGAAAGAVTGASQIEAAAQAGTATADPLGAYLTGGETAIETLGASSARTAVAALPQTGALAGGAQLPKAVSTGSNATAGASSAAAKPGILDKLGSKFSGLGEKTQAAIIQTGGQMVSGAMQGAAAASAAADEARRRREDEERYNQRFKSGSGLTLVRGPQGALSVLQPGQPGAYSRVGG